MYNDILFERFYIVKAAAESLQRYDTISGFEVIPSGIGDDGKRLWLVLLPIAFNERTIIVMQRFIEEYTNFKNAPAAIVSAIPHSEASSEFGSIQITVGEVVENQPNINVTWVDVASGYSSVIMYKIYNKDIKSRLYLNDKFITFNPPTSRMTEKSYIRIESHERTSVEIYFFEIGTIGLRTITGYYGNTRVLVPDVMTSVTCGYLDSAIKNFALTNNPNWRDYPVLVTANEIKMSKIGLPELQILKCEQNNIAQQLFRRARIKIRN